MQPVCDYGIVIIDAAIGIVALGISIRICIDVYTHKINNMCHAPSNLPKFIHCLSHYLPIEYQFANDVLRSFTNTLITHKLPPHPNPSWILIVELLWCLSLHLILPMHQSTIQTIFPVIPSQKHQHPPNVSPNLSIFNPWTLIQNQMNNTAHPIVWEM